MSPTWTVAPLRGRSAYGAYKRGVVAEPAERVTDGIHSGKGALRGIRGARRGAKRGVACRTVTSLTARSERPPPKGGPVMPRSTNKLPIFAALDAEWRRFVHTSQATDAVERWRRTDATLAELHTVADVLVLRRNPARADVVLRALVGRADRDVVAGRVVLQAVIPGLVRIARFFADDEPDATASATVSIAWERICDYPGHRPGPVAPNILLDVRKQVRSEREPLREVKPELEVRSAEDIALEHVWLDELRSWEQTMAGDGRCFDLIVANRIDGHPIVELARARGVQSQCLLMRRRRAEQRLRHRLAAA